MRDSRSLKLRLLKRNGSEKDKSTIGDILKIVFDLDVKLLQFLEGN